MSAQRRPVRSVSLSAEPSNLVPLNEGAEEFENRTTKEDRDVIVLINAQPIILECLAKAMRTEMPSQKMECFSSVDQLKLAGRTARASLIVLCQLGYSRTEAIRQIEYLSNHLLECPAVVLSDNEDPEFIVEVLGKSVRGYITTSLSLCVAIQAMQLVQVGGVFVPASSLIAARRTPQETMGGSFCNGIFTARQAAVVEALRRGKANKIIAYELNMKESTVKVHVRNIMKKLRATNRTHVAYIANRLINGEDIAS